MRMRVDEGRRCLIVALSGEIDHHAQRETGAEIDHAFGRKRCRNIVFDFAGVSFMDSSGVGLVIGRYRRAREVGGSIAAVNLNPSMGRIFEISGLKKLMPVYGDVDSALSRM
ncbi:MAG: anti-sigma factor antagonist [Clostridiales bacterium]|jgi:stage II sporulation protein AA (anti-sigma F factor antagonist)|nr:anti-sigma factor antagonist [Clostridiales bacterium]